MVFHLVALGAMVLVGKALQEGANSYERKKARDRAAIANMASTPKGYLPQSDLLFDFPLEDGEELIATFEFVASKWMKDLYSSNKMFPSLLGSRLGIGHVTNKRILLFYDLKRIHGSGKWTGQSVKNAGKVSSTVLELAHQGTVGKLFEGLSHIDSETRSHMEKIAAHFPPYGVATCPRGGKMGLHYGTFFALDSDGKAIKAMTFSPAFVHGQGGKGDDTEIFKKILNFGVETEIEEMAKVPYYGTRAELKLDIV